MLSRRLSWRRGTSSPCSSCLYPSRKLLTLTSSGISSFVAVPRTESGAGSGVGGRSLKFEMAWAALSAQASMFTKELSVATGSAFEACTKAIFCLCAMSAKASAWKERPGGRDRVGGRRKTRAVALDYTVAEEKSRLEGVEWKQRESSQVKGTMEMASSRYHEVRSRKRTSHKARLEPVAAANQKRHSRVILVSTLWKIFGDFDAVCESSTRHMKEARIGAPELLFLCAST